MKKTKIMQWLSGILLLLFLVGIVSAYFYVQDYYRADQDAIAQATDQMVEKNISAWKEGNLTYFYPPKDKALNKGFIFYPGGKVAAEAYLPLLSQITERGYTVVLVEMPFNLAVLDSDAALEVIKKVPAVNDWYLGGHSLGGAMASGLMKKHAESFKGLILLAAYPINDATVPSLAIYGSNDKVLRWDNEFPPTALQILEGGNHAQFGDYGPQEGDGEATLSRANQQRQTVELIDAFIQAH